MEPPKSHVVARDIAKAAFKPNERCSLGPLCCKAATHVVSITYSRSKYKSAPGTIQQLMRKRACDEHAQQFAKQHKLTIGEQTA